MGMVTGGELVVRTLLQAGVSHAFALYGGHLETVFQACRKYALQVTDVRHEMAAGHAAEGYARSRRTLGVAFITAGPGFTNVITSIANAYLDRTPVLYICASAALIHAETNMVQGGFDQLAVAKPITKWAHRVTVTQDIPRLVAHAIRIATTAPTGPVLLELPVDVSFAPVDDSTVRIPQTIYTDTPHLPQEAAVAEAIKLLAAAQRPVIMVGEGAWQSGAADELRAFVAATGIPVFAEYQAHGLMPGSHPLYAGGFFKMLELTGANRPDVVLALGVRFGMLTLARQDRLIPAEARVIHVEVDAKEIGRLRDVTLGIVADSREVLKAFNRLCDTQRWPQLGGWQKTLQTLKAARAERFAQPPAATSARMHPHRAVSAVVESLDDDAILIGDGAEAYHWLAEVARPEKPDKYFTHGYLGALGFGLGFAIGVQVAHPGQRVVCVIGDGGVGITLAEFDTMARHRLPITVVVMNNRSWGATRHFQDLVSGPGNNIAVDLADARYHDVAAALGCHAEYVTAAEDLKPALARAFSSRGPACINVEIDVDPIPPDSQAMMSYA